MCWRVLSDRRLARHDNSPVHNQKFPVLTYISVLHSNINAEMMRKIPCSRAGATASSISMQNTLALLVTALPSSRELWQLSVHTCCFLPNWCPVTRSTPPPTSHSTMKLILLNITFQDFTASNIPVSIVTIKIYQGPYFRCWNFLHSSEISHSNTGTLDSGMNAEKSNTWNMDLDRSLWLPWRQEYLML